MKALDSRRTRLPAFIVALACTLGQSAHATPDARAQTEIDHLLQFVATSGCTFIRGGTPYTGDAARDHLQQKFRQARSAITSADQFVTHVASRSSVTGAPYRVRCGNTESDAGSWIEAELRRFRASR